MSAREEVLARLRAARDEGAPRGGLPPVPRDYGRRGELVPGGPEVLALFAERVEDYRARVVRVATATEVPTAIATCLREAGARTVVVPTGLPSAWREGLAATRVFEDSRAAPLSTAQLDDVDCVVTASAVAVADTGTVVLDGSPDQGRRAISLVPDHHVCVVLADAVVQSFPESLERLDPTAPLTFISGPSATSDIELDRVEGVHGPRRLDVVLVG